MLLTELKNDGWKQLNSKLGRILRSVENVSQRLSSLETKFCSFESQLKEIDEIFLRCSRLETDINSLDLEIKQVGSRASVIESAMTSKFDEMEEKIELNTGFDTEKQADLLTRIALFEVENLMRESYDKRLNLLVHGLEETEGNETKDQTKAIFDKFLTKVLGLAPDDIDIVDLHCLPQHPIRKEGRKMNRPIIFKVLTTFDKKLVYQNIAKPRNLMKIEILKYSLLTTYQKSFIIKKRYYYQSFMLPNVVKNRFVGALLKVNTVCTSTINAFVLPIPKIRHVTCQLLR